MLPRTTSLSDSGNSAHAKLLDKAGVFFRGPRGRLLKTCFCICSSMCQSAQSLRVMAEQYKFSGQHQRDA